MYDQDNTREYRIGQIYVMLFSGSNSEQRGFRPGLVFQNNVGNKQSPNIIAIPFTSAIKNNQPTHVLISAGNSGLKKDSTLLCENPERMSKENIGNKIGELSNKQMQEVVEAYLLTTSAISFISPKVLINIWRKAIILNK